jgi:ribosome hibernation promoting factor
LPARFDREVDGRTIRLSSERTGGAVRIEIKGRNTEVTDEIRERVAKRFARVARQVSDLAQLEIVLREEKNPAITDRFIAEANLHVKGATIHAQEASPDMLHSIHELAEDIRRQVKRHREKRRARAKTRRAIGGLRGREA